MVALLLVVEEGTAAVPPTDLFLEEERVRVDIIIYNVFTFHGTVIDDVMAGLKRSMNLTNNCNNI